MTDYRFVDVLVTVMSAGLLGLGCGGSQNGSVQTPASATPTEKVAAQAPAPAKPVGPPRADVAQFRSVFAPLIALQPGEVRGKALCDSFEKLANAAGGIDPSAPKGVDGRVWRGAFDKLTSNVAEMGGPCQWDDLETVDEMAKDSNTALRKLVEMSSR